MNADKFKPFLSVKPFVRNILFDVVSAMSTKSKGSVSLPCKKILLSLVLLVCAMVGTRADTWKDPDTGITWTYTVSGDTVSVGDSSSSSTAVPKTTVGAITIPSLIGDKPVTSIDFAAFYRCSGLTSVTIPNSVTNIGWNAFYSCSGLTSVTIPNSVTSIGGNAFWGCSGLENIEIPNSVVSIGESAFSGCSGLTNIILPFVGAQRGNSGTDSALFGYIFGHASFPGGVATWFYCNGWSSVFYIPISLKSVTVTDDTIIGDGAFSNCSGLTSVVIPENLISIEDYAFYGCSGMTSIMIGNNLTNIGSYAFSDCSALESVTIPASVKRIGDNAFDNCPNLQYELWDGYKVRSGWLVGYTDDAAAAISDADRLRGITSWALEGCVALEELVFSENAGLVSIGTGALKGCTELQLLVLPPSLEEIGDEAFMGCSYLDNVIVPGSVKRVGARAFKNCTGFTAAQIEHGVESLGDEAFYGDWQIAEVDIPSTVTNIGANAFGGDSSIIRVGLRGDVRPVSEIFSNYASIREATVKEGTGPIVANLFNNCSQLKDVHFFGDCPGLGGVNIYMNTKSTLTTYVEKNSTGWDGTPGSHALPQAWPLSGNYRRSIAWWDEPTYLVRFDSNGGTLGVQDTYQRSERSFVLPPEPVQTGYTFAGWWTKPSGGLRVTADTVFIEGVYTRLYAHWTKGHWVFLDPNGGTVTNEFVTYVDQTVYGVLPTAVRTGYAFGGWRYEGRTILPATPIVTPADHTLTAQWEAYQYSIRFDANGGTGEMADIGMAYDEAVPLTSNVFTRSGYEFGGWATSGGTNAVVVYAEGETVENLSAEPNGIVTLFATWNRLVVAAPIVTPGDGALFTEDSCEVSITCVTDGAVIYCTTNGVSPRLIDKFRYTGPFSITGTAVIKAVAVLEGVKSDYATATITKRSLTLGEAASADASGAALAWTTGGDAQWTPEVDATSPTGFTAQSGAIGDATEENFSATWLQTEVSGAGTVSFRWKVDCEWDDSGEMTWDHVAFYTNGVEAARMDGTSGWEELSFAFADAGTHTLHWTFMKDDYNEEVFADRAWVSGFTWTPAGGSADVVVDVGSGKSVTVPGTWIAAHENLVRNNGGSVSAALASTAANGRMSVAECYVVGVDPEKADDDFKITSITIGADGTPVVEFDPPQAEWNVQTARPVVKGAAELGGEWQAVTDANKAGLRFFKVVVELP